MNYCAVFINDFGDFFSVAMPMHMTITKKAVTYAHLIFIMAGLKEQLIPMENGK